MSICEKNNNEDESIKVVLLGNSGVGKTAIIQKFNTGIFEKNIKPTFDNSSISKKINIKGKNIFLSVWDTAGQEQYRSIGKIFLKNAKIAILVYDITSKKSFNDLSFWYDYIKSELGDKITLGLAGNKADLFVQEEVSKKNGEEIAKNWGAIFSLLSAKEDKKGIDDFFTELTKKYLNIKIEDEWEIVDEIKSFRITETTYMESIERGDNNCCGGGKNKKEKGIKIAFLGSNGVGKTNIVKAIKGKPINIKYQHTKKITKKEINYSLGENKKIKAYLIDTNGDDCKNSDLDMILKECKIIFLVFDLNNRKSFKDLEDWIKKISVNKKNIKFLGILGNKTNLNENEKNTVTNEEAEEFSKKNGANYLPISIEDISKLQESIKNRIQNL